MVEQYELPVIDPSEALQVYVFDFLDRAATINPSVVQNVVYAWACCHGAGLPVVPLIENTVRDEARFWAETAGPAELECYAFAALDKLARSPLAVRQSKRMLANLFKRLNGQEQADFARWIIKEWAKND